MKIQRYFAREVLVAFSVAFLVFFLLFFLNQILLLADRVLSKKAPWDQVFVLIVASLPSILALTAPFATLLGILLAIGRLAADGEVLAAQASGIPHRHLLTPIALLSLVFALGSFAVNDVLLPQGAVTFNRVYRQLLLSSPELELGSYSVTFYQQFYLVTGRVEGNVVHGISLLDRSGTEQPQLITAKTGLLLDGVAGPGVLTLRFLDVLGITPDARRPGSYDWYTARQLDYQILLKDLVPTAANLGPKEKSTWDLGRDIQAKQAELDQVLREWSAQLRQKQGAVQSQWWSPSATGRKLRDLQGQWAELKARDLSDRLLSAWKTEYFQKFSLPLACLTFVVLCYPLAIVLRRWGMTGIIGVGLLVAVSYWALLLLARTLALEWSWPAEVALFLPHVVILGVGVPLLVRLGR